MSVQYRYASTMGESYALPVYFLSLAAAQKHKQLCQRLLGGLPGQGSMEVQEWVGGEWVEVEQYG